MKSGCMLLFILMIVTTMVAQEPVITPDMQVDSARLHQWLHSGDPRLIAWAADFARRNHDAAIIAEMPDWLEHWTMPPSFDGDDGQTASRRAVLAVLDSLIQENVVVPIATIDAVTVFYPAQAAILISRQSLAESRMTLEGWTAGMSSSWGGPMLARIATLLLAKDPSESQSYDPDSITPRRLVATVVAQSEEDVHISVNKDGKLPMMDGAGAACGDGGRRKTLIGWPKVYQYDLEENNSNYNGPLVAELASDRIAAQRHDENGGWGSCYGVQPLNRYTRHRLIAYWLGISDEQMPWKPDAYIGIAWTNRSAYERELARIMETERKKSQATVKALRARGLISDGWTENVIPKLVVTIQCDMKPCPLQ